VSEGPGAVGAGATLVGIGLGPGDPELITMKGLRTLRDANVVFVPVRRTGEESYALQIASELVDRSRQTVVTLPFPKGEESWESRCQPILDALAGGGRGVFLTEGDPSLYSTFGHVAAALRAVAPGLRIEAVPGVSSVTAAAAAAGLTLADWGEQVAIVPAAHALADLPRVLGQFETVILIKVSPVLREVLTALEQAGRTRDGVYVRRCGRPDQQIVYDLTTLVDSPPRDYFSLIVVRRGRP
jgi:precorrin-2/cobalt-factor-2 C20-methyltransferase